MIRPETESIDRDREKEKDKRIEFLPNGNAGHGLEPLLAGGQGGGSRPEVDQVLLLHRRPLLDDRPQPPLERYQPKTNQN